MPLLSSTASIEPLASRIVFCGSNWRYSRMNSQPCFQRETRTIQLSFYALAVTRLCSPNPKDIPNPSFSLSSQLLELTQTLLDTPVSPDFFLTWHLYSARIPFKAILVSNLPAHLSWTLPCAMKVDPHQVPNWENMQQTEVIILSCHHPKSKYTMVGEP